MSLPPIFIPDTHGQLEALKRLLGQLEQADLLSGRQLVFLGDYLDADSNQTVSALLDYLLELQQAENAVCIAGNHDLILRVLSTPGVHLERSPAAQDNWYKRWLNRFYGTENTLSAYGIQQSELPSLEKATELPAFFRERIPAAHLDFLRDLPLYWEQEQWIAVHAGVRPEQPLPMNAQDRESLSKKVKIQSWADQRAELDQMMANPDLCFEGWGPSQVFQRELTTLSTSTGLPWEDLSLPADKCVVSGHQIQSGGEPLISPARALLDLGAYYHPDRLVAWVPDCERLVRVERPS